MKVHAKILANAAAPSQASTTAGRADSDDTTFGDTLSTLSDESAAKDPREPASDVGIPTTATTATTATTTTMGAATATSAALLLFPKGVVTAPPDRQGRDQSASASTAASPNAALDFLDLVQVAATSKSVPTIPSPPVTPVSTLAPAKSDLPPLEGLVAGVVEAAADRAASPVSGSTKASDKASSSKTASQPEAAAGSGAAASPPLAVDPALVPIVAPIVAQVDDRKAVTPDVGQGAVPSSPAMLAAQAALANSIVKIPTKTDEPASLPVIGDVRFESHLAPTSTTPVNPAKPNAPVSVQTNGQSANVAANASDAPAAADASALDTGSSSKSRASSDSLPASAPADVRGADSATVPAQGVAMPLSLPTRTVLNAVTGLAAAALSSPGTEETETAARTTPARTMLLQLTPGDLGTVSVRLHLTGHTLDVSLTASSAQTTGLLSRERDALGSALRGHDYQVNSLVIQGADAQASGDSSPQSGGFGASTQDMPQGQGASDRGSGLSGNGGRQAQDGQPSRQEKSQASATAASSSGDRASGLFL